MSAINTSWPNSNKEETGKDVMSQAPQQIFLLTVAYPPMTGSNGQILKTVPFVPNASGQQQILLQPVSSVIPMTAVAKSKSTDHENVSVDNKEASYTPLVVVSAGLRQDTTNTSNVSDSNAFLLPNQTAASSESLLSQTPAHIEFELNENTPVISFDGETLPDFSCEGKSLLENEELSLRESVLHIDSEFDRVSSHKGISSRVGKGNELPWNESESDSEEEIIQVISDKPVTPRAKLTLPVNYLTFNSISLRKGLIGVFAKKEIPERSQFGPMDGVSVPAEKKDLPCPNLKLLINKTDGTIQRLCIENEELTNWMRYVRVAFKANDQNVALSQIGDGLYFTTIKTIQPGEELRVWYSKKYASKRNLPLLTNTEEKWCCPKCPFTSLLNKSMNHHLIKHRAEQKKVSEKVSKNQDEDACKRELVMKSQEIWPTSKSDKYFTSLDPNYERVAWCRQCNLRFNTSGSLNLHMLSHAADNLTSVITAVDIDEPDSIPDDRQTDSEDDFNEVEPSKPKSPFSDYQDEDDLDGSFKSFVGCDICGKTFKHSNALNLHYKSHYSETFECPLCRIVFEKVLDMKSHIKTHRQANGSFQCTQCPKEFPTYKQVRRHMKISHADSVFCCGICQKEFKTAFKLKLHMSSHSNVRHFLCADCGKQFKRKDKLSSHMKLNHDNKTLPRGQSRTPREPQKDNLPEFVYGVYKCTECQIGFKKRGVLVNHILSRHPGMELESVPDLNQPILKPSRDYFCQYCDRVYKSATKRKVHILKCHPGHKLPPNHKERTEDLYTHTVGSVNSKPACCKWCSKQYSSNAKLLQHQRKVHLHVLPKPLRIPGYYNPSDFRKIPQVKIGTANANSSDPVNCKSSEEKDNGQGPTANNTNVIEVTGNYLSNGGIIVDGPTLKKALKLGEPSNVECLLNSGLEQFLSESRPDQYFEILTQEGITIAQPVEIWDPLSLTPSQPQSATNENSSTQIESVKSSQLNTKTYLHQ